MDGVKTARMVCVCVCVVLVYFCRQTDTHTHTPPPTHTDTHRAGSPRVNPETAVMMKVKSAAGRAAEFLSNLLTGLFRQWIQCITRFMSVTETLVHRTRFLVGHL